MFLSTLIILVNLLVHLSLRFNADLFPGLLATIALGPIWALTLFAFVEFVPPQLTHLRKNTNATNLRPTRDRGRAGERAGEMAGGFV